MSSREDILKDLIELRRPLADITEGLAGFSWDSEKELVRLTNADVVVALRKFVDGELSNDEIEQWASLIECRDDIDYEDFSDLIFRLATPEINGPLDLTIANEIIGTLEA